MSLINKEKLMQAMYHRAFETDGDTMWQSGCWVRYRAIEDVIKSQPTQPERIKAKWWHYEGMYICENCNAALDDESPFCPMCGADMREENNG